MLVGVHAVLSSSSPEADLAFFRDVLKLPSVADGGYVIFGLPPAELSVHQADESGGQALFLMCKSVKAFTAAMAKRGIACKPVEDQGWGLVTQITLPGGGSVSVYQPRHKRPSSAPARKPASKGRRKKR